MELKFFLTFFCFFFYSTLFGLESKIDIFEETKVNILLGEKKGNSLDIGLNFSIEKDWKIYWIYPGDAGSAPILTVLDSKKYDSITPSWPFPEEEYDQTTGLISRIYKNNIIIPYKIFLKKNYENIDELRFKLEYQICKDICIPVTANFILKIPKDNYKNQINIKKIDKYKKTVPKSLLSNSQINFSARKIESNKILLKLSNMSFSDKKEYILKSILIDKEFPELRTKYIAQKKNGFDVLFESEEEIFLTDNSSIVFIKLNDDVFFHKLNISELKNETSQSKYELLIIFITAFFAGFILNFMPCVLPVLGIKINNLLKQTENRNNFYVKLSSFYLSLGILSTFIVFSLVSIFLRSIGISLGWGIQFQSPIFLIFLLSLLLIFTAIAFDLIKISYLQKYFSNNLLNRLVRKNNLFISNYTTGILSTLLATPCTAPMVGSAISYALSQNYLLSIPIFMLMGLGKALPYLLFIIKPNILWYLPKPGIWMKYIKFLIGLLLFVSILWLGKLLVNHYIYSDENYKVQNTYNMWEEFDKDKLLFYIKNNEKVLLDITAEWCINCKINKKFVLEDKGIQKYLKDNNIKLMRADWTFPDKNILDFLKEYNRYGIPFNIFFSESYPDGFIFSEILRKSSFLKILEN
ncbi:MAG: Thiol:disulfide interchange protein DsbD [Alphaproteobacteria bacterium MarineAlpha9_Bin4]|nr:hypothetical protein [Pelagibacterales bacterium]PPR26192.1 MAG: Thiol:disulfide interchange protein DsbD [Alphaproteobacteria bacterium MarineAlpha9_Bin4]|tara:strand:- start:1709 stop:3619 length:1911 start_codon:yes stop_codon:yes gene_type:complete